MSERSQAITVKEFIQNYLAHCEVDPDTEQPTAEQIAAGHRPKYRLKAGVTKSELAKACGMNEASFGTRASQVRTKMRFTTTVFDHGKRRVKGAELAKALNLPVDKAATKFNSDISKPEKEREFKVAVPGFELPAFRGGGGNGKNAQDLNSVLDDLLNSVG